MELGNDQRFCTRCGKEVTSSQAASKDSSIAEDGFHMQSAVMQSRFPFEIILPSLALGLIFLCLVLPWLVISALGQQMTIAPADIIRATINNKPDQVQQGSQAPDLSAMPSKYLGPRIAFGLSVLFLPTSMVTFAIAIAIKNHRLWLASTAGTFAILSGVAWIWGIESMKSSLMAESSQGGMFGAAFASMLISAVSNGSGVYLAIVAGVIGILTIPVSRMFEN